MLRTILFTSTLLLTSTGSNATEQTSPLVLAATDWCPYSCSDSPHGRGIVADYLTEVFEQAGIALDIRFLPWSRALVAANTGIVDGLLTAVAEEAPQLLLPKTATMFYQDCFFVKASDSWYFDGEESLHNIRLAYIKDYGYNEPVNSYLLNPPQQARFFEVTGADPSLRLIRLIHAGRADALIEEKRVASWANARLNSSNQQLKQAGCLEGNPIYVALNPQKPHSTKIIKLLNEVLQRPDNLRRLEQLTQRYTQH